MAGWNDSGPNLSPLELAEYERVGAYGTAALLCVGTHMLVSITIMGSRRLGHGGDICAAPCACFRCVSGVGAVGHRRSGGSPQQKD